MAKPKKKRDLRARLGRTITPKTKGGGKPAAAPPSGGVAPPNLGGEEKQEAKPGVTPPPAGVAKPPASIGAKKPSKGVAAPPFAQPAAPAAAPAAAGDPFAAQASQGPQVVRLEFDDKAVSEAEVGKKRPWTLFLVGGITLVVGLGVGFFGGSTFENNKIFDRTVHDAQDIHASITEASDTVEAAQRHVGAIATAATGNQQEGTAPSVDYDSIEALRALEKPFDAHAFNDKMYGALGPQVVNDLFDYNANVQSLWGEFQRLAATTLPEARRTELTESIERSSGPANYGAVLSLAEDGTINGSLAFISASEEGIMARATRGGQGRVFQLYQAGEQEIASSPEFVLVIDAATSRGVLGESMGAFGQFVVQVNQIKTKLDQTVEIQGRLLTAISSALSEAGASVRRTEGE